MMAARSDETVGLFGAAGLPLLQPELWSALLISNDGGSIVNRALRS